MTGSAIVQPGQKYSGALSGDHHQAKIDGLCRRQKGSGALAIGNDIVGSRECNIGEDAIWSIDIHCAGEIAAAISPETTCNGGKSGRAISRYNKRILAFHAGIGKRPGDHRRLGLG